MVTYNAYDPRWDIREKIGFKVDYNNDDVDEYVINVLDDNNDVVSIPLLIPGETQGSDLYNMPYIEMVLISAPANIHNVTGNVREQEAYIDFNIWYTNTDNITPNKFGYTAASRVVDLIMTYRHSVTSVDLLEVIDEGREIIEHPTGKQPSFHRVLEIYCKKFG